MRLRAVATAVLTSALAAGCAQEPPSSHATATAAPNATVTSPGQIRAAAYGTTINGTGDATQVVTVATSGYRTTYATVRAYRRTSSGWVEVYGPWRARIGYNGLAPRGDKREGDGRTPSGSFGFSFMFGVRADPGVHYRYRRALRTSVWADDPASPRYNTWVDLRYRNAGRSPEPLRQSPAYDYAAVIAYNTARTPGRGSAIFLHVSHGSPTAGCVSLPASRLLRVLRWLRPARHPRIVIGPRASVFG